MSSFNSSVFASCLHANGFKEIKGPNDTCRLFELTSAEGLPLAQVYLDHRNTSTFCVMQQEYEWNIRAAKILESSDDFMPSYERWLKHNIVRAVKEHQVGFSLLRRIQQLYANTCYSVKVIHDFNMPLVEIQCADGEDFYTIQKYSVCVDENSKMYVTAHIAGRATRYESAIEQDLEFVKLDEWLSTEHRSGFNHLRPAIEREVEGRIYHLYRTQDAARKLPLYRDAKTVKIIRETLVAMFEGGDAFDLIGEIDIGRTTYEFIAYEIGVVI